uniref:RH38275p n=1 Tax=Drosophila melanogaster TaxID=7227 RepID=Q8IGE7_DROME|nr:RH38275p [Drosophila melanogaster]
MHFSFPLSRVSRIWYLSDTALGCQQLSIGPGAAATSSSSSAPAAAPARRHRSDLLSASATRLGKKNVSVKS